MFDHLFFSFVMRWMRKSYVRKRADVSGENYMDFLDHDE